MKNKRKIFISYTTRDGNITKLFLERLEKVLSIHSSIYIDLIHNNSKNKQNRVLKELKNSDILILIRTSDSTKSDWVQTELKLAKELNIPIAEVDFKEVNNKNFQPILRISKTDGIA